MKALSADLQAHLDGGATTLAWCWRLTRRDGTTLGFTDHDRDVTFDGTLFEAAAGFAASEVKEALGLAVANLSVEGALSSGRLSEADLSAGLFDDAKVEVFRVNWQAPEQRVLMRSGSLGEVKRSGGAFSAEVRGLAHNLQQPKGRLFQYTCDADLGDTRCGVNIAASIYRGSGAVALVSSERRFMVSGLAAYQDGWFTRGLLRFTSGAANGQAIEIKRHAVLTSGVEVELWAPARGPLSVGQTFSATAGCDKHFETCCSRFSNAVNFRGFPAMPGNDFVTRRATQPT